MAKVTDDGITLSAMKLDNPQGETLHAVSAFYSQNNELILESENVCYRVYATGAPNALRSPSLTYELIRLAKNPS